MQEFTLGPLGESRSARDGRRLVGSTFESACMSITRPSPLVLLLNPDVVILSTVPQRVEGRVDCTAHAQSCVSQ